MTFEKWLKTQIKRDDPVGDMAKDFIDACKIDRHKGLTRQKCDQDYLDRHHACDEAYDALKRARNEFKNLCNILTIDKRSYN